MNNIKVKSVKFSGPATIVFFEDGTKAVTKCRAGDEYNAYLGVSWAICKKVARDRGLSVSDFVTSIVPQESYRSMPTFTTHVSVRTIAQLVCEDVDYLADAAVSGWHEETEPAESEQAFDESLCPENAYAGRHRNPGGSRFKPLIDAFIASGLPVIRRKYVTSSIDFSDGRRATNNVQACIGNYIKNKGLSDVIRVYCDNGYICVARINK